MTTQYKKILNECMLEFIKKFLERIQYENLYWDQLINISYKTDHPAVILFLKVKQVYPQEITIVLQHQFENLTVKDTGFSLTVSFDGIRETIYIPFDSLISFVDSSNNYSFTFNQQLNTPNIYGSEVLKIKKQVSEEVNNNKIDESCSARKTNCYRSFKMSWIDKLFITFFHKKVGEDELLNQYYESKKLDYLGRPKRFIVYKNTNEPTKISPSWNAWLHHLVNEVPKNMKFFPWQENNKIIIKTSKISSLKYNKWQP